MASRTARGLSQTGFGHLWSFSAGVADLFYLADPSLLPSGEAVA